MRTILCTLVIATANKWMAIHNLTNKAMINLEGRIALGITIQAVWSADAINEPAFVSVLLSATADNNLRIVATTPTTAMSW